MINGNTTVYAQWILLDIVTFNKNGGDSEASPPTMMALPGTSVGTLPTSPARTGYSFAGWNTQANGSGSGFTADSKVDGNITLYAQWTRHIGSALVNGLTAPVLGVAPVTWGNLSAGDAAYSVQGLSWSPVVSGQFANGTVYQASIVLKAAAGYTFYAPITPAVGGGRTLGIGTITGEGAENTLAFIVSFPGTATGGTADPIAINFADLTDLSFSFPEHTLYKISFNGSDKPKTATLTLTSPIANGYSDIKWSVDEQPKQDAGASFILNADDYAVGSQHWVTVELWKDNAPYSKSVIFNVVY
jgi:uncharacterized repeat protein (TIGR02543 family)